MKRMSIAEITLKRQIEYFTRQFNDLHAAQTKITTEMEVLETVIGDLKLERERLERQRQLASDQRKPRHYETPDV